MDDTRANEEVKETPEPVPSLEKPQVNSETPSKEPEDLELPDGVSDRTRQQFEKLRSQLAEERQARLQRESVFSSIRPSYQPPVVNDRPLYDPNTGFIDPNELDNLKIKTLSAEERAMRAEQTVQKYVEEQQTREALQAYPELDATKKGFSEHFYKATRAVLLDSVVNPQDYGNKTLSYREAAELAKSVSSKVVAEAEKIGATKAIESLTPKEQAALEATGRSDRALDSQYELEELSDRTRRGDLDAIIRRMKSIPAVGK